MSRPDARAMRAWIRDQDRSDPLAPRCRWRRPRTVGEALRQCPSLTIAGDAAAMLRAGRLADAALLWAEMDRRRANGWRR